MRFARPGRRAWFRLLAVAVGLGGGLVVAEVAVRLLLPEPFRTDRLTLCSASQPVAADCYPTEQKARFPVDLRRPADEATFRAAFPAFARCAGKFAPIPPSAGEFGAIAASTPLCVTYDLTPFGDRRLIVPRTTERATTDSATSIVPIALLGDSFVWGQGLSTDDTLPRRLVDRLGVPIRSYAESGDDLPEILGQFDRALKEAGRFGYSRIIYVLVLNDLYRTGPLHRQQQHINDLMNIKHSAWRTAGRVGHWLDVGSTYSRLVAVVQDRITRILLGNQTLAWYRTLLSPAANPRLNDSFDVIADMRQRAAWRGIQFELVIYPLMIGFSPYPLEAEHAQLQQLAAARHLPTLDLLPVFAQQAHGQRLVVHSIDYHPNALAQRIAGDAIADFLRQEPITRKSQRDRLADDLLHHLSSVKTQPGSQPFEIKDIRLAGEVERTVLAPAAATRMTWRTRIPAHGWLKTSLGVREDCWGTAPSGVRFTIGVSHGGVYDQPVVATLRPDEDAIDRRWQEVALDLSTYAGQTVDVIFNTRPVAPMASRGCAMWGAPRLVTH